MFVPHPSTTTISPQKLQPNSTAMQIPKMLHSSPNWMQLTIMEFGVVPSWQNSIITWEGRMMVISNNKLPVNNV